jgi:hypothetical protein
LIARTAAPLLVGVLLAALLGGCGISHTLWGVSVVNASDAAIVVREGRSKWLVPPHGSGQLFGNIADELPPETHDYEVLDAVSCELLDVQRVVLDRPDTYVVAIGADRSVSLATFDPSIQNVGLASAQGVCPGRADGWSIWIENPTDAVYFVRNGNEVARVGPKLTRVAVGGFSETSVLELFDADCRPLEAVPRSGWGPIKGTIVDDHLVLDRAATQPAQLLSFGHTGKCQFSTGPSASP